MFKLFDQVPWMDELAAGRVSAERAAAAAAAGARRKMLAQGETGLFVQYSELPPNFRIPPHAHSHGEVLMCLRGSCTVDGGPTLGVNDAVCVPENEEYGISVGPEGMVLLTIRAGDAVVSFHD